MGQSVTHDAVMNALVQVMDPEIRHSVVELGMIQGVEIEDAKVYINVVPTSAHCPYASEIVSRIERAVGALAGVERVLVEWGCEDNAG